MRVRNCRLVSVPKAAKRPSTCRLPSSKVPMRMPGCGTEHMKGGGGVSIYIVGGMKAKERKEGNKDVREAGRKEERKKGMNNVERKDGKRRMKDGRKKKKGRRGTFYCDDAVHEHDLSAALGG